MICCLQTKNGEGGSLHPRALLSGFTELVNTCQLLEFGYVWDKYTWERSRGKGNQMQEHLDRGLAMQE